MNIREALKSAEEGLKSHALNDITDFNGIKESVESAFRNIQSAMFPQHVNNEGKTIAESLRLASGSLRHSISRLMNDSDGEKFTAMLISRLQEIRRVLMTDITAAYEGEGDRPCAARLWEDMKMLWDFTRRLPRQWQRSRAVPWSRRLPI